MNAQARFAKEGLRLPGSGRVGSGKGLEMTSEEGVPRGLSAGRN